MTISFWSPVHGAGCVTSNMVLLSADLSRRPFGGKILLLENHSCFNGIGSYAVMPDRLSMVCENANNFYNLGIDGVLKNAMLHRTGSDALLDCAVKLSVDNMYYFPQSYVINREVYEQQFYYAKEYIYESFDSGNNIIFTDVESSGNRSSAEILDKSDLVVVCLPQNSDEINAFFQNYSSLISKSIFIISRYKYDFPLNVSKLKKKFPFSSAPVFTIPYNLDFEYAANEGKVIQFVYSNSSKATQGNEFFMKETHKVTDYIRSFVINYITKEMS